MLKIQELEIDGIRFRIREPRLVDYLRAKKAPDDEFVFAMLAGMMLKDDNESVGEEYIKELPLRVFNELTTVVNKLTGGGDPLDQTTGSSSG